MKTPLGIILAVSLPVFAQENSQPTGESPSPVVITEHSGEDENPSLAPTLGIRAQDIRETTVRELDEQKFIFQRVQPVELAPPQPEVPPTEPLTSQELAAAARAKQKLLFLGGSVYSADDSPDKYRTLVRYWPEGGEEVIFWSSANFLFLGGFASFEAGEGNSTVSYSLILSASDFHMASFAELPAKKPLWDLPTDIPEFPEGKAKFVVVKGSATPEQLAPIQALHDLYNSQINELKASYLARVEEAREREEYLKAHPPEKKNLIFHHWRIDDPGKAQEASASQQQQEEGAQ